TPVSSTIFDVTKVKVGDKIGDWTIITIEAPDNKYAGWTPKNDEVSVEFVGNVAVSGKFKWDSKITGIKFYPDSESQNKLPKIVSDNNSPYLVTTSDSELINGDQGDIEMSLTGFRIWSTPDLGVSNQIFNMEKVVTSNVSEVAEELSATNNVFTFDTIKVGDQIGTMIVQFIQPASNGPVTNNSNEILFTGETEISGTYTNIPEGDGMQTGVCFNLDENSTKKIPTIDWRKKISNFCFTNQGKAATELGPSGSTGTATIIIDNYQSRNLDGGVWDIANLVEVISKD
ncbi:MAG: hypothetical protein WC873_01930, partial [Candidatus Gracilibacteria bacterium]